MTWEFEIDGVDGNLTGNTSVNSLITSKKNMKIVADQTDCVIHDSHERNALKQAEGKYHSNGFLFCAKVTIGNKQGKHQHGHALLVLKLPHPEPVGLKTHLFIGRVFRTGKTLQQLLNDGWSGATSHNGTFHSAM